MIIPTFAISSWITFQESLIMSIWSPVRCATASSSLFGSVVCLGAKPSPDIAHPILSEIKTQLRNIIAILWNPETTLPARMLGEINGSSAQIRVFPCYLRSSTRISQWRAKRSSEPVTCALGRGGVSTAIPRRTMWWLLLAMRRKRWRNNDGQSAMSWFVNLTFILILSHCSNVFK